MRPLTGKIIHSNQVGQLTFSDGTTVKTTAYHPFFSQDRQECVPAAELLPGEQIKTKQGIVSLVSREALAGNQLVYNLEVYQNHNYLVGKDGLLVHNACPSSSLKMKGVYDIQLTGSDIYGRYIGQGKDIIRRLKEHVSTAPSMIKRGKAKFSGQTYKINAIHRLPEGASADALKTLENQVIQGAGGIGAPGLLTH